MVAFDEETDSKPAELNSNTMSFRITDEQNKQCNLLIKLNLMI